MQNIISRDFVEKSVVDGSQDYSDFCDRYAELIEEYGNLADYFGIPEMLLKDCYREGLEAYQKGDYLIACRIFALLTHLNPREGQLHLALGNALQQLGEHASALPHFSAAADLLPDDPGPLFRVAECQVALAQCNEGRDTLRRCLNLCATSNTRPGVNGHAAALLNQII